MSYWAEGQSNSLAAGHRPHGPRPNGSLSQGMQTFKAGECLIARWKLVSCNLITEATSFRFCYIFSVRSKSLVQPTPNRRGLQEGMSAKRQGPLRPSQKSAHHNICLQLFIATQKELLHHHYCSSSLFTAVAQFSLMFPFCTSLPTDSSETALSRVSSKWNLEQQLRVFASSSFLTVTMNLMCGDRLLTKLLSVLTLL